ncbi:(-)-germacrene D synthase, partial [Mucuna pruriens]
TFHDYYLQEGDNYNKQVQLLKEDIRKILVSHIDDNNLSSRLNFIDAIQRLGVFYHFEHEIDGALHQIYDISTKDNHIVTHDDDLYHVALLFRLLRQQGYRISSDIFYKFKDQSGNFNERLANDLQGMLSLYEATQLRCHGEEVLEEAHNFTLIHLTKSTTTQLSHSLAKQVRYSLRQSLHKGIPRLEARYYMSFYQDDPLHDEKLLTFAKLDFNMLQELHQKEVSIYFEPQYSISRRITIKVIALCSIIDDMYDAYGTMDELELFTNAIESITKLRHLSSVKHSKNRERRNSPTKRTTHLYLNWSLFPSILFFWDRTPGGIRNQSVAETAYGSDMASDLTTPSSRPTQNYVDFDFS